jgi:hypothetical protein
MLSALALTARWENMARIHSPLPAESVKPASIWIGLVRKKDARGVRLVRSPRRVQRDAHNVQWGPHLRSALHNAQYVKQEHTHQQSRPQHVRHALQVHSVPREPVRV